MVETNPTYNFEKDGSINIPVDGKPIRFVKESDLLAVKGGAETKVKEWETKETSYQTQLAEANRLREETHQSFLKAQAEHEQWVEKTKDYETHKTRVGELEKEIATHKEGSGKLEKELAELIKVELVNAGANPDSFKDATLVQLRNLRDAAKVFGSKGGKPKYDGGGPGGAGGIPEDRLARAHRILEDHEAKGHRMGAKGAPVKV